MLTTNDAAERKSRRQKFIGNLLILARPEDEGRKDREALAVLRGSLRGAPIDQYRAAKYVVPYLGDRESADDRWFYLVGGLLALHPKHELGVSPGRALHALRGDSGSIDSRVLSLLGTRAEALPRILRQMVALLQARGIGLDYFQLLDDLCAWDTSTSRVQKRWARDYFRDAKAASAEADAIPVITSDSES